MKEINEFTFDDVNYYKGLYDKDQRWNGFYCPSFPISEVKKMKKHFTESPTNETQIVIRGDIVWIFESDYEPYKVIQDESGLYPIGSCCWVWFIRKPVLQNRLDMYV